MRKRTIVLLVLGVLVGAGAFLVGTIYVSWGVRQMYRAVKEGDTDTVEFVVVEVCRGPVAGNCILLGFTRDAEGRASHPNVRVAVPYEDAWRYYPGKKMRILKEESVPKSDLLPTFQGWDGCDVEGSTSQE